MEGKKNILLNCVRETENLVIFGGTDRFVRDDVLADGEAHTGAEAKRGGDGAAYDAVSAHDSRSYVAQSPCHFPFFFVLFPLICLFLYSLVPNTRFSFLFYLYILWSKEKRSKRQRLKLSSFSSVLGSFTTWTGPLEVMAVSQKNKK